MRRAVSAASMLLFLAAAAGAVNIGYDVSMDQIKERIVLSNSLSLRQELTSRLTLNSSANFTGERNRNLNRFIDGRAGNASLSYTPYRGVEFGVNLARSISSEERNNELVKDQLSNTTSGQIRFTPASWISVNMRLGAHFVNFMNPSGDSTVTGRDEGGVRNVDISLNRSIFRSLSGSISFAESRTLGYQRDTGRDNLTARASYRFPSLFEGGSLDAQFGATKLYAVFKDSNRTQNQDDMSSSLSLVVPIPYETISMEVTTGWDYSDRYYLDHDPDSSSGQGNVLDRTQMTRDIASSLRYLILDDLKLDLRMSRRVFRVDQKRTATGVTTLFDVWYTDDDRNFSSTLTYTPGDSRIIFYRAIQLIRRDTYGTWTDIWGIEHTDNFDYDQVREVLSLSTRIPLGERVTFEGLVQGQSRETVYLMSEQSGNSRKSSTYIIEPGFIYDAGGDWKLREKVQLSADYTTYLFPECSYAGTDLLFRRVQTNSSFQRVAPRDSTTLGLTHTFRFQDQGTYENSIFLRSEEVIVNTVRLDLGFHVGRSFGLTPSYAWEYQRRNYLAQNIPSRIEHLHHVGLRTRLNLSRGALNLNLTRSFYSRDDRDSYWKATVGLNYQF